MSAGEWWIVLIKMSIQRTVLRFRTKDIPFFYHAVEIRNSKFLIEAEEPEREAI
jgi:hypothetical protein